MLTNHEKCVNFPRVVCVLKKRERGLAPHLNQEGFLLMAEPGPVFQHVRRSGRHDSPLLNGAESLRRLVKLESSEMPELEVHLSRGFRRDSRTHYVGNHARFNSYSIP